jgi:hypothetical protein
MEQKELPNEIIGEIFKYFSQDKSKKNMDSFRSSSKFLNTLACETIHKAKIHFQQQLDFFPKNATLTNLHVHLQITETVKLIMSHPKIGHQIQKLSITSSNIVSEEDFISIANSCPALQHLHLKCLYFESFTHLNHLPDTLTNLTLHCYDNPLFYEYALVKFKNIESIHLSLNNIWIDLNIFGIMFGKLDTLKTLSIDGNIFNLSACQQFTNVKSLSLLSQTLLEDFNIIKLPNNIESFSIHLDHNVNFDCSEGIERIVHVPNITVYGNLILYDSLQDTCDPLQNFNWFSEDECPLIDIYSFLNLPFGQNTHVRSDMLFIVYCRAYNPMTVYNKIKLCGSFECRDRLYIVSGALDNHDEAISLLKPFFLKGVCVIHI